MEYCKDNDDNDEGEEREKPAENLRRPSFGEDSSED